MGPRLVVASLGGLCIAFSFPPVACWPAVFVGVALLLRATRHTRYGASLLLGWVGGCVGHIVAFAWLWKVIDAFTGGSPAVVIGGVAAFVGYHALQLALFTLLATACMPRNLALGCTTAASVWVAVEWLFPKVIPWTLGDGLSPSLLLRQAADLTGPQGLSFAIAATAAVLARFPDANGRRRRRCSAAVAFGAVALWTIYGGVRLWQFDAGVSDRLRVTLVQGSGIESRRDSRTISRGKSTSR
jgi:apolipoprotein N-acyltransferase